MSLPVTFLWPNYLWLLIAVPLLVLAYVGLLLLYALFCACKKLLLPAQLHGA